MKKKAPKQKMLKQTLPNFIKPMLATYVDKPFSDPYWVFEIKWDGYRALAYIQGHQDSHQDMVNLYSRNKNSFNAMFPQLVKELQKIDQPAILDGEIVVLDQEGRSDFQCIQNFLKSQKGPLIYYAFDLLFLDGQDLRHLPLLQRKEKLNQLLQHYSLEHVRYSDHLAEKGEAFFKEVQRHHLEGMIAKNMESTYHSARSKQWLKIKTQQQQEVLIGGFTAPTGERKKFGSLLLGVYNANRELVYVGHVGTGFSYQLLTTIYEKMQPFLQTTCPFSSIPPSKAKASWIKPELACEVAFSEWTQDGRMRHPVFKGLRNDKNPQTIVREQPISITNIKENFQAPQVSQVPQIHISNPEKIYFLKFKYTKKDIIDYYVQVSSYILPYLKDRPMVLRRFPEGAEGESFVQKNTANLHIPSFMTTIEIQHTDKKITYFVIQNLESLEYIVNLGSIEMHPFHSTFHFTLGHLDFPDYFILDLDPENVEFDVVILTAQTIHAMFKDMHIPHYYKTSGKRGMHLYIPLGGKYTEEQIAQFGEILARIIHQELPTITSLERNPAKRQKKIYLDVLQNRSRQTVVSPYSLRGTPYASVSAPLYPSELVKGMRPEDYHMSNMVARLNKIGDIFAPVLGKGFDIKVWLKAHVK